MNSGCYGHEISKILLSFKTIDFGGNIKEILASDINFNYRSWWCVLNFIKYNLKLSHVDWLDINIDLSNILCFDFMIEFMRNNCCRREPGIEIVGIKQSVSSEIYWTEKINVFLDLNSCLKNLFKFTYETQLFLPCITL